MAHPSARHHPARVHPDPLEDRHRGRVVGQRGRPWLAPRMPSSSADAGQYIKVGSSRLCWVQAERLIHKLVGQSTTDQRQVCARIRARVWTQVLAPDQGISAVDPTPRRKRELQARFDRLFTTTTGFATLDRLLARFHANKVELLRALERPDIPL